MNAIASTISSRDIVGGQRNSVKIYVCWPFAASPPDEVKSDRCFTVMEPVIRKMNELVSAAAKLNGFDNRYLHNGEWNMTAEGGVGSLLTMLAQNAVYFALCDFDRAIALSSQFERREIRMMAQLKLAQGVLQGPPKTPLFANDEN